MRAEFRLPPWLNVSRETHQRLAAYAELVIKWSNKINLVSKADKDDVWGRHVLDSAQLMQHAPKGAIHWLDLGSGGGFPGLVLAILEANRTDFTLVEADTRKCAFLRSACLELSIEATIVNERIEALDPIQADVITARALAPVATLLEYASAHLKPSGFLLFPKGAKVEDELTAARNHWNMEVEKIQSITENAGTILKIGGFSRV